MTVGSIYDVILSFTTFLSLSTSLLVVYVALFRSPRGMNTYTPYIVNFTSCDVLVSITVGILVRPDPVYPFDGAAVNGLFKYFGEQGGFFSMVIVAVVLVLCLSAQCHCIIYRVLVLRENKQLFILYKNWSIWVLAYVCNFASIAVIGAILWRMQIPREDLPSSIKRTMSRYPDAPLLEIPTSLTYMDRDNLYTKIIGKLVVGAYVFVEVLSFACVFQIFRDLQHRKTTFSKVTYRMHAQLAVALGAQIVAPIIFVMGPVLYIIASPSYGYSIDWTIGQALMVSLNLYPAISAIFTLYFIKPYRQFVLDGMDSMWHSITNAKPHKREITIWTWMPSTVSRA